MQDDRRLDRRRLLQTGGAALASGLGGCVATLPPLGQRVKYGKLDVPDPGDPAYRTWLPDPAGLSGDDPDPMVHQVQPRRRLETSPTPHLLDGIFLTFLDYLGVDYHGFETVLRYGRNFVVEGGFDPATVVDTLTGSVYAHAGTLEGHDLYRRTDPERVVLVGADFLVHSEATDPESDLQAILDARVGRTPRYHEVDDAFDRASRAAGGRLWTWRVPLTSFEDQFGDDVLDGMTSTTVANGNIYLVIDTVFEPGTTPSTAEVKELLQDEDAVTTSRLTDVTIDEGLVSVALVDTDGEFGGSIDDVRAQFPPWITWGFDRADDRLTVTHAGGDRLDLTQTTLSVDGNAAEDRVLTDTDVLAPGDQLVVEVADHDHWLDLTLDLSGATWQLLSYDLDESNDR